MFEFAFSQYENYIQLRNNLLAMSLLQTQLLRSDEALPMSLSPGLQFNVNEPHRHKYIRTKRVSHTANLSYELIKFEIFGFFKPVYKDYYKSTSLGKNVHTK